MVLKELFVRLGLDVDAQSFMKGKLAADSLEVGFRALYAGAKEAIAGLVEMVQQTADTAKELEETAQATGLTTRSLQELRKAAMDSGVDAQQLDTSLFRLARSMTAAKKGSEDQSAAFSKLGVKVTDASGKLRSADEVMMDLSDGFQKMPDGLEKTNMAMEVFGRTGARLIPMLNQGSEKIAEIRKGAFVMDEEQIKAGKELVLTQRALTNVTKNLWRGAIAPLLPAINQLLKRYLEWRKANAAVMAQNIKKYIGAVIKVIGFLGDAFVFLQKNAVMVKAILIGMGVAFALLKIQAIAAAARIAIAWLAAAAPFILIGALIAGLLLVFDDLRVYNEGGDSLYGDFKKEIDSWLKPSDKDAWFVSAIKTFIEFIKDAMQLVIEFNEVMGKQTPAAVDKAASANAKQMQAMKDRITIQSARTMAASGHELTPEMKQAVYRQGGVMPEQFYAKYAPSPQAVMSPAPGAMSGGPMDGVVQQQNTYNINGAQDPQAIMSVIDQHQQQQHEQANAALESH